VCCIEGDRKLSEQFWKAEVERYKHDLQLAHTQDYEPYQAAVSKKKKKRGEEPEDWRRKRRRTSFRDPA